MRIHFVLVCEGSSDEGLIPHLRSLLVDCGANEATGVAPDYSRLPQAVSKDLESKIRAAFHLEGPADLLFVHRDADSRDPEPKYEEIRKGVEAAEYTEDWIGVVPVQEMEAWLLLDERAIRRVSGRPRGRANLNLPSSRQVETVADPKERLFEAIRIASEKRGRRLDQLRRRLPLLRAQLLSELKVGGLLMDVPAWRRLRDDTVLKLASRTDNGPGLDRSD